MADFYVWSGSGVVDYTTRAWALGDRMVIPQANTSANHRAAKSVVWECTTAGTTTTTPTTWPATITRDVTTLTIDGVVFTARRPGFSSGSTIDWTFAAPGLVPIIERTQDGGIVSGDFIFVASDHNGTDGSASTGGSGIGLRADQPLNVISVARTVSTRPTTPEIGSVITFTAAAAVFPYFSGLIYGIRFVAASGLAFPTMGQINQGQLTYDSCQFDFSSVAGAAAQIGAGATSFETRLIYKNCWFNFVNSTSTTHGLLLRNAQHHFIGGGILSSGVSPKQFLPSFDNGMPGALFDGFDFSHLASDGFIMRNMANGQGKITLRNCRFPSTWTGGLTPASVAGETQGIPGPACSIEARFSGSSSSNMTYSAAYRGGTINTTAAVFRSGFPSGAGTAHSLVVATNAFAGPQSRVETPEMAPQPLTAGTPVTVSVDLLTDNVTLTDADAWIEGIAMTTSGSPLGTPLTTQQTNPLATPTNIPTSTETWTSPGITTPVRQKLSLTFTPAVSGWAYFRVHIARPSTTVYVDPIVRVA